MLHRNIFGLFLSVKIKVSNFIGKSLNGLPFFTGVTTPLQRLYHFLHAWSSHPFLVAILFLFRRGCTSCWWPWLSESNCSLSELSYRKSCFFPSLDVSLTASISSISFVQQFVFFLEAFIVLIWIFQKRFLSDSTYLLNASI